MTLSAEQRDFEQRLRVPAAVCAALAAVLLLAGTFILTTLPETPAVGVFEALSPAFEGREDAAVNPRVVVVEWWNDNVGTALLGSIFSAIALLCLGVALLYLYRVTDARAERVPRVTRYAIYFGPFTAAVAGVAATLALGASANDFLAGDDFSREALEDALGGTTLAVLAGLRNAGMLAVAVAVVLVSLHAMRAGLLTRFLGILGIIVGVLFVLQFGALPLVQAVWIASLAPLFLLRWPGGNPPAWERGEAVPWPSQQAVREARIAAAAERKARGKGGAVDPAPEAVAPEDDAGEPAPAPKPSARKRKRRR